MNRFLKLPFKTILFHPLFLACIIVGSLVPVCGAINHLFTRNEQISFALEKVDLLEKKGRYLSWIKKNEEQILGQIKNSDPLYMEKICQSLTFLEAEKNKWLSVIDHVEEKDPIRKRLDFLESSQNRLSFEETKFRKGPLFQEVEERQKQPIELSEEDLKKLLSSLEGIPIQSLDVSVGRPYILITHFDLSKKTLLETKEKVYMLSTEILKREKNSL